MRLLLLPRACLSIHPSIDLPTSPRNNAPLLQLLNAFLNIQHKRPTSSPLSSSIPPVAVSRWQPSHRNRYSRVTGWPHSSAAQGFWWGKRLSTFEHKEKSLEITETDRHIYIYMYRKVDASAPLASTEQPAVAHSRHAKFSMVSFVFGLCEARGVGHLDFGRRRASGEIWSVNRGDGDKQSINGLQDAR